MIIEGLNYSSSGFKKIDFNLKELQELHSKIEIPPKVMNFWLTNVLDKTSNLNEIALMQTAINDLLPNSDTLHKFQTKVEQRKEVIKRLNISNSFEECFIKGLLGASS